MDASQPRESGTEGQWRVREKWSKLGGRVPIKKERPKEVRKQSTSARLTQRARNEPTDPSGIRCNSPNPA